MENTNCGAPPSAADKMPLSSSMIPHWGRQGTGGDEAGSASAAPGSMNASAGDAPPSAAEDPVDPFAAVQNVDDFYRILQYGPEPLGQYDPPPPALPPLPTPALHLGGQRSGGDLMSSLETGSRLAAPGGPDPHHDWWPISGEGKTDGQLDGLSIVPTGKSAEDEEGDEEGEVGEDERHEVGKSRGPFGKDALHQGRGTMGLKWGSVTTLSETHRAIMISDKTHTKKEEELVQLCAEFAGFVARFNLDSSVLGNEEYLEFVRFLSEDADLRFNPEDESPGFSFLSGARHEVFGMASEALAKLFKLGTPTRLKQKLKACQFLFYVDKSGRQYFYHDEFRPGHDGEEASEFIALQQDKVKFKDLQCKRPPPELRAATSEDAKKKRVPGHVTQPTGDMGPRREREPGGPRPWNRG
ncbi:hypothetical protein THAOC_02175 [Thalassiosira oceanica]|uniref:Uncharacterized protein n=1 Tax=Thalassiosira oceanica TaxID=159749 RepID=K0TF86_THAOC|nr:hypothetical protein THAOC_02175 [Thalassiosira oceanica]|eukprot:EJK76085.1 hypothetical protein THAOC_02175 [Thalassiosira oceanica]